MRAPTTEELLVARRVWRLAILLTADPDKARRAMTLVPPPPRGQGINADRLDRLAIQAIRRVVGPARRLPPGLAPNADAPRSAGAPAPPTSPAPAPSGPSASRLSLGPAHDVVAGMPMQAAEVWVLRRIDELDPVRTCRAMDCSRTAADRFLARADSDLAAALGESVAGEVASLRQRADALIPDGPVVEVCTDRARQRARRHATTIVVTLAAILGVIFVAASAATLN